MAAAIFKKMQKTLINLILIVFIWAFQCPFSIAAEKGHEVDIRKLTESVLSLKIGIEDYVLGAVLTSAQFEKLKGSSAKDAYPGTLKFHDGELIVVVDESTKMVIALNERHKNVTSNKLKVMVGDFMLRFGEPTAVAHEKIIYWVFDSKGKTTEDAYKMAKDEGDLKVIATVMLQSYDEIIKVTGGEIKEAQEVYYLISSEPLLKHIMKK
jgi:hypothetical protein